MKSAGGAGVSFYCSTQTGEDHRYVWTSDVLGAMAAADGEIEQ